VLQFLGLGLVLLKPSQVDFGIRPSQILMKLSYCIPVIILSQLGISKILALAETRIVSILIMLLSNLLLLALLGIVFRKDLLQLRREMAIKAID
jgi:DMSO/TMAO reductase YedYZ heme-binding membrane subunit